jgi:hypothetical protein
MARQDISWSTPRETFNLRVAAVIGHSHKVLLCTVDGLGYWFLPGVRVRFGESAQLALSRELTHHINPGTRPSVEAASPWPLMARIGWTERAGIRRGLRS